MKKSESRVAVVALSLLSLFGSALPGLAQTAQTAPARRSPVAFGLGPLYFHDWQGSLRNTFAETVVTVRDLDRGGASTTRIPGDPALNNRKFDLDFEIGGPGVLLPLTLPVLGRGPGFSLSPTLALEVARADFTFTFHDRTQPALSTALRGDGLMLGAGLEADVRPCARCAWTTNWSYWYRNLSGAGAGAGRSAPIAAPGQQVTRDDVTVSRETHELAARAGYAIGAGGRRYVPYVGALVQSTDVAVDDRLTLVSPTVRQETAIRSRSRFASDVTRALAGVEGWFGPSLSGRLETSVGGGDRGVRFAVRWSPRPRLPAPPEPSEPRQSLEQFAADGPLITAFTSQLFAVEIPVRGGWPVVVDYELEQEGFLRLEIATDSGSKVFELLGEPGKRTDPIRWLPRRLGGDLQMATVTVQAFRRGSATPVDFTFHGLGAGEGAVASLAIRVDRIDPNLIGGELGEAKWRFVSRRSFDKARVRVYLRFVDKGPDGIQRNKSRKVASLPAPRSRCTLNPGTSCGGMWDGMDDAGDLSVGSHSLVIAVWGSPGYSVTAVAPNQVEVEGPPR